MNTERTERIRELNDLARTAMGVASRVIQTDGIRALDPADQSKIREKVELFKDFTTDNDPYGEHDFGAIDYECIGGKGACVDRQRIYWKIDYYDKNLEYASEHPEDPAQTVRVLTIMLAEEY